MVTLRDHELFRMLVDSVRDYAIFMLDPSGRVATWNSGAARTKGYTADEIIGRHFSAFYPAEDAASGKCEHELAMATAEGRFEDEGWRIRKDGSRFWANVVISAVRDSTDTLIGFSKVTRDLTERRDAEAQRAARLAAEQANKIKDEFLAMLGHELRNPLSPIVTALQIIKLRGGAPSKELQIIERQVTHMMTLVDDLLDVSRITSGKITLRREAVDLREAIARGVEIASPLLEQRRHHLAIEQPDGPLVIDGDPGRMTQILANLLTNAAKYTDPGGHIAITARRDGAEAIIEVKDDGVGIPADLLPRVFEVFVQGHQSVERTVGGLGLGLTLVRRLTELHGGGVSATSAGLGAGSTFVLRLPLAVERGEPQPVVAGDVVVAPGPAGRRILVVDDNEDARELLGDTLVDLGHEVRRAADGVEALEIVRGFVPEVAILDIGLPVMDGYELAERLRGELGVAVPRLIALTGYGRPMDREQSTRAGFAVHLVKPVDLDRLIACIDGAGDDA